MQQQQQQQNNHQLHNIEITNIDIDRKRKKCRFSNHSFIRSNDEQLENGMKSLASYRRRKQKFNYLLFNILFLHSRGYDHNKNELECHF